LIRTLFNDAAEGIQFRRDDRMITYSEYERMMKWSKPISTHSPRST